MSKNYVHSLLILSLCMVGVNVSAHDIEVPNADGVAIYYNYINDSTELAVTFAGDWYGYTNNEYSGVVVIPEEVTIEEQTLKVALIDNGAFSDCYELTSVTIPNSVTNIGNHTFSECRNLTSVNIPNGVTSIGNYTFDGCSSLTSITIPNSVTTIGENAFNCCVALTSISIPNSVKKIGTSAFYGCGSFTSVRIPDSVVSIEDYTFAACISMTSIIMGNNVESIGNYAFAACQSLTSVTIPDKVTSIGEYAFYKCFGLTYFDTGNGVTSIGKGAFKNCTSLSSVTIGKNVTSIGELAFEGCFNLNDVYCYAEQVLESSNYLIFTNHTEAILHVPAAFVGSYQAIWQWKDFKEIVALTAHDAYRPFVEEGKVWKVGSTTGISDGIVKVVEYCYFDGDTIIDGKTCKQMMCQRYVNPEHPDYANISQLPSLSYVGAWYEEDKKVYEYDSTNNQFKLMYDFSLDANAPLQIHGQSYVIGSKQTGGMKGFKGVYRDVMMKWDGEESIYNTTWLEGVGGIDGPTVSVYLGEENHVLFLMSCTVGDEVIYFNDEYEDGTTTGDLEAKKHRFDFTHTVKTKPKAPRKNKADETVSSEMQSLYGEYNERQLGINLNPLDDAYIVRIANESGNVVYEKAINAGSIVALNIDISAYAKGRYTVIVENSNESFTGEFDTQTTGIIATTNKKEGSHYIYNLQGQRLSSLQKGLNIVGGRKIIVK